MISRMGKDTQEVYAARGVSSSLLNNAIPLEPYNHLASIRTRNDPVIVSFIGRLSAEKGFIQYIDAVNLFKENMTKHQ